MQEPGLVCGARGECRPPDAAARVRPRPVSGGLGALLALQTELAGRASDTEPPRRPASCRFQPQAFPFCASEMPGPGRPQPVQIHTSENSSQVHPEKIIASGQDE